VSAEATYARSATALWRRVGAEVLLASPEGTGVESLSVPASAAWLLLERPRTAGDLAAALAGRFPSGSDGIERHVSKILEDLGSLGWIVREDARG